MLGEGAAGTVYELMYHNEVRLSLLGFILYFFMQKEQNGYVMTDFMSLLFSGREPSSRSACTAEKARRMWDQKAKDGKLLASRTGLSVESIMTDLYSSCDEGRGNVLLSLRPPQHCPTLRHHGRVTAHLRHRSRAVAPEACCPRCSGGHRCSDSEEIVVDWAHQVRTSHTEEEEN